MRNTFCKEERLTGTGIFTELATKGNSFFSFPFRIVWNFAPDEQNFPARVAFAVPKKLFRNATDRNRIKRLSKEVYRQNKHTFYDALNNESRKVQVLFIYTHKEVPEYRETEDKIILSLQRLIKAIHAAGNA